MYPKNWIRLARIWMKPLLRAEKEGAKTRAKLVRQLEDLSLTNKWFQHLSTIFNSRCRTVTTGLGTQFGPSWPTIWQASLGEPTTSKAQWCHQPGPGSGMQQVRRGGHLIPTQWQSSAFALPWGFCQPQRSTTYSLSWATFWQTFQQMESASLWSRTGLVDSLIPGTPALWHDLLKPSAFSSHHGLI